MIGRFLPFTTIILFFASIAAAQPELDITFNGNGRAMTSFGSGTATAYKTLVQPDNKIVAVGTWFSGAGPKYFALARYNEDGTPDQTFGDAGLVITDFNPSVSNEGANSGALQADGKIIAAGYVRISQGEGYFALVRYNTDGSIDTSFGTDGKVTTAINNSTHEIRAVAVGPDGRIVAAGTYANGSIQTLIACYDTAGGLLWTKTDIRGGFLGDVNAPNVVVIRPNGSIITGGSYTSGGSSDIAFVSYTAAGAYGSEFPIGGRYLMSSPNANESVNDIALYPDGKMMVLGETNSQLLLMRMFGSGVDISFNDGRVTASGATGRAVYLRPNGKILVAGSGGGFSLLSFNPNGSPDTSFSGDGRLSFDFDGITAGALGITFDGLGRPVVGGGFTTGFAVARLYTLDPVPVTVSGQARTPDGSPIRNLRVGLTDASGVTRWAITSNFGFFNFDGVPTGQTYNLFVRGSKTYIFESRDIGLNEAATVDLIGTPRPEMRVEEVKTDLPRIRKY